jgi:hypothetical protein
MAGQGEAMNILFSDAVLMRSLILFLILGSVIGLIAGLALLLRPNVLMHLSKYTNRWVSTRQMGRSLEQSVDIEHWLYRYSRWSGAVLMLGAVYIVYMLTTHIVRIDTLAGLARMHLVHSTLTEPLLDALVLLFLAGAVVAIIISLFLMFRPSMLRDLELGANQNISLRQTLKPVEIQRGNVDQLVFMNGRLVGVALLCGSFYTLVVLIFWLIK